MRYRFLLCLLLSSYTFSCTQSITGTELLSKTIRFHDPDGQWKTFSGELIFAPEKKKGVDMLKSIKIDQSTSYFEYQEDDDRRVVSQTIQAGECTYKIDGAPVTAPNELAAHQLSCERTKQIRDFYLYLYGLPMKLKDTGTVIDETVLETTYRGERYLRLRVTYDKAVGNDIWYFYIDPDSYEMKGYQFLHNEEEPDGEYVTLEGLVDYEQMKIPKLRKWYLTQGDKYLGANDLVKIKPMK